MVCRFWVQPAKKILVVYFNVQIRTTESSHTYEIPVIQLKLSFFFNLSENTNDYGVIFLLKLHQNLNLAIRTSSFDIFFCLFSTLYVVKLIGK